MSNEPDERQAAEDDASEDLELNDENADQVRGGLINKLRTRRPTRRGSSATREERAVSDKDSMEPNERMAAEDDAKEDLELNDETADQVRGGTINDKWEKK